MARVFLSPVQPPVGSAALGERLNALSGRLKELGHHCSDHELIDDPGRADIILLNATFTLHHGHVDPARLSIRRHPLRVRHPDKCFVYDPDDDPCLLVPGVFASLDCRTCHSAWHRAGGYLHMSDSPFLECRKPIATATHLFSFVGAPTHAIRRQVLELRCRRGHVIPTDARWPRGPVEREIFRRRYADAIHDSVFVLCPRGRGTSSARLFEVLQAGRVPVIISDHWVPPSGPDWNACSVRVAEHAVADIPLLLESLERDAAGMAAAARLTYETWFSKDRAFGHVIDWCLDLKKQNRDSSWNRVHLARHLFRPSSFERYLARPILDRLRHRPAPAHGRPVRRMAMLRHHRGFVDSVAADRRDSSMRGRERDRAGLVAKTRPGARRHR